MLVLLVKPSLLRLPVRAWFFHQSELVFSANQVSVGRPIRDGFLDHSELGLLSDPRTSRLCHSKVVLSKGTIKLDLSANLEIGLEGQSELMLLQIRV